MCMYIYIYVQRWRENHTSTGLGSEQYDMFSELTFRWLCRELGVFKYGPYGMVTYVLRTREDSYCLHLSLSQLVTRLVHLFLYEFEWWCDIIMRTINCTIGLVTAMFLPVSIPYHILNDALCLWQITACNQLRLGPIMSCRC